LTQLACSVAIPPAIADQPMQTHDLTYGQNTAELSFTGGQVHTVNARNDIVEMVSIDCKAPGMPSIEALQKAVYERAATQPPGAWIRGRGYDQTRLHEGRHPTRDGWDVVARVNTKRDGLW
jgi:hypothetical protein